MNIINCYRDLLTLYAMEDVYAASQLFSPEKCEATDSPHEVINRIHSSISFEMDNVFQDMASNTDHQRSSVVFTWRVWGAGGGNCRPRVGAGVVRRTSDAEINQGRTGETGARSLKRRGVSAPSRTPASCFDAAPLRSCGRALLGSSQTRR